MRQIPIRRIDDVELLHHAPLGYPVTLHFAPSGDFNEATIEPLICLDFVDLFSHSDLLFDEHASGRGVIVARRAEEVEA